VEYDVMAVNANGRSARSAAASIAIDGAPTRHIMKMN
jgi:hypothetical protein